MSWTTNYHNLKPGDVFELEGLDNLYVVINVQYNLFHFACGNTTQPPTWNITTNKGHFTYDPWANHTYKKYKIIGNSPLLENTELKDVKL
jgi:hypothetical protein